MAKVATTVEVMESPSDAFAVLKLVCDEVDQSISLNVVSIKNYHHRTYLKVTNSSGREENLDIDTVLNRFFKGRPEFRVEYGPRGEVTIVKN